MRLNKANQFFENKGISIVDFYINAKTPFYRCTVYKNERHLIRFKTFYKFIKKTPLQTLQLEIFGIDKYWSETYNHFKSDFLTNKLVKYLTTIFQEIFKIIIK